MARDVCMMPWGHVGEEILMGSGGCQAGGR